MKSVTYWYQFFTAREELVPILHDVKFTKCEICGSTKHHAHTSHVVEDTKQSLNHEIGHGNRFVVLHWVLPTHNPKGYSSHN